MIEANETSARQGYGADIGVDLLELPIERRAAGYVLAMAARQFGSKTFVTCSGEAMSFEEADRRCDAVAAAFGAVGVSRGARVAILSANCLEYLDIWFGLARIGAIQVPLNTAYRAQQILHTMKRSRVAVLIVQPGLWAQCQELAEALPELSHVVFLGDPVTKLRDVEAISYRDFLAMGGKSAVPRTCVLGTDAGAIMNTSGTTGPAKGVLLQHSQQYWLARNMALALDLGPDDIFFNFFPLFHNTAQAMITLPCLLTGAQMVLTEKFSLSTFWLDVQEHHATIFYYIGEILNLLVKKDPGLVDDVRLRAGWGIGGAPADVEAFQRRHRVQLGTGYGSTEANVPVFRPLGAEPRSASAGKVLPEFELRIVDDAENEVPVGEIGEILVRTREEGAMLLGYDGDEQATHEALRGGWFHTGDAGRIDADGNFYFVARLKDVIRVRGENVSAFEVEAVLLSCPGILEAAAIAVPGEIGGDDVKAVVVARQSDIDLRGLIEHCEARLPKFAVPRYVEVCDELPKTATNKVRKAVLRDDGLNTRTWDSKSGAFIQRAHATYREKRE
jgi:carnitine-CoA ligase